MKTKTEIRNKDWYDKKTSDLKHLIKELRSFDPFKKLIDDNLDELNKDFQNMLWSGQSTMYYNAETNKLTAISPLKY